MWDHIIHAEYTIHRISKEGLHPTEEKLKVITEAPAPKSISQLNAELGMLNYYGNFLPNSSTILTPLYSLLHKNTPWNWGTAQKTAFSEAKMLLTSSQVLVHFDHSKPLVLSYDVSPYGVGGVLSHKLEDGLEHPVAFASRSLSPAERKYS